MYGTRTVNRNQTDPHDVLQPLLDLFPVPCLANLVLNDLEAAHLPSNNNNARLRAARQGAVCSVMVVGVGGWAWWGRSLQ